MSPKSMIGLTEHLKSLYKKVAEKLQGSDRRQFMAEVIRDKLSFDRNCQAGLTINRSTNP